MPPGTRNERSAADLIPARPSLATVRAAAKNCQACDLYRATRPSFAEGAANALPMLIGEQPGDTDDIAGHRFVGPAGELLDRALDAAGVDRSLSTSPTS